MKRVAFAAIAALAIGGPVMRPAFALPTMVRLGYANCAACHNAPQGAGLLNAYGRGIDQAQSFKGGEYKQSTNALASALSWGDRITQDFRFIGQETVSTNTGAPILGANRNRFMYRNATELGKGFRLTATIVGETLAAARPNNAYDPATKATEVYVPTALISYRAKDTLEFSFGRDEVPTGINLPDLGIYVRARNQYGYYDAPTQFKAFIWGKRYLINPYVFGPGGNEKAGFHESGGGMLAEVDVLGHGKTVVGVNGFHGVSHMRDRTMIGPYVRLGFGRWGIFAEHDVTDRTMNQVANAAPFRQHTSYAQVFLAVREWLVPSVGFEQVSVHRPYRENLVAPRFELSARLSSNFTLGFSSRIQENEITGKVGPSVAVSLTMKTVR